MSYQEIFFTIQLIFDKEMFILHRSSTDHTDSTRTMIDLTDNLTGIIRTAEHLCTFVTLT